MAAEHKIADVHEHNTWGLAAISLDMHVSGHLVNLATQHDENGLKVCLPAEGKEGSLSLAQRRVRCYWSLPS